MENNGLPVNLTVKIDYKSAAIIAGALFVAMVAALVIYKNV